MENDRSTPDATDVSNDDYNENDPMDKYDDAVLAADATGMLAGERLITVAEIAEANPDLAPGANEEVEEK
jgi:hypothetical protein